MTEFAWVPYEDDSPPAPYESREQGTDVTRDDVESAFRGYSDGRAQEAERERLERCMEEARVHGAKLEAMMKNPKLAEEHDEKLARETVERVAAAHGGGGALSAAPLGKGGADGA